MAAHVQQGISGATGHQDDDLCSTCNHPYSDHGSDGGCAVNIEEWCSCQGFRGPLESEATVNHPSHYHADTGIEVIDAIEAWQLGFSIGNAVKYIARHQLKGQPLEDLHKAQWYLGREIGRLIKATPSSKGDSKP